MREKQRTSRLSKIENKKPKIVWNREEWIQKTLTGIEERIAQEAYNLRTKFLAHDNSHERNENEKSLNELKMQESNIRERLREIRSLEKTLKPKVKEYHNFPVKSNSELRKLTKKYREFKQSLVEKSRMIEEEEEQDKIKAVQLEEEHMKSECKERREKIEETLKEMEKRRKKRLEDHAIEKQKLKELKKQKLFEKMNENWNTRLNEYNEEMKENYEIKKKGFNVDMSSLSVHEKEYNQAKEEIEEKRTLRMAESRLMLPHINVYKSKYFDNVVTEEKEEKKRREESLEQKRILKKKHKEFQEKVKSEFAPAIKSESESSEEELKQALDREEALEKGNEYLKESKKLTIPREKREEYEKKRVLREQAQNETKEYHNYIPEAFEEVDHTKKQKGNIKPSLKKLKKLIENDNVDKYDKIEEVKGFVDKLTHAPVANKLPTEQQLMQKINAKIQLLEMLN